MSWRRSTVTLAGLRGSERRTSKSGIHLGILDA
jgi:hypothetical protein